MSREEIRGLIGGYATGSLTEAERALLFEAALEDQEIFEELAREQGLKEMLGEPGVRDRLIAGLQPSAVVWWKRPVVWRGAVLVVAALVVVGVFVERPGAEKPVEVAEVRRAAPVLGPGLTIAPGPAMVPESSPAVAPASPAVTAPRAATLPPKAAAPQARKKSKAAEPQTAAADASADASAKEQPKAEASTGAVAGSANGFAPMAAPPVPQRAQAMARLAPAGLAFNYKVDDEGLLLTFASDGYLSLHFSPGDDTIVGQRVTAGSTDRQAIPNNATEVEIIFSSSRTPPDNGVTLNRNDKAGTVTDARGSRIELLLRLY